MEGEHLLLEGGQGSLVIIHITVLTLILILVLTLLLVLYLSLW